VAREKSEDSATAPRGGKIPAEIVRGANPFGAAFEATVFSAPVGIVPEVVATSQGFHVFRVESRKEGRLLPLGEVKEQLRSVVLNERREQALDALLARLRREAKVETGKF
jgi:parvulin-like peptidyl-prolyl isomerase